MCKFLRLSLVATLFIVLGAMTAAAQTTTGGIGGVVTNPAGEVVPGATVTVRNVETNKEATATTDDQGRFMVGQLDPGSYSVSISSAGFSVFTQPKVTVEVGRTTTLEVPLSVGPVDAGTVNIASEAPVINTTQQDFSTNINQTSINELPINGRRWSNFALLTPGAVPDGTFGLISFRGISGLLNNNTIDGGDNNQAFFAEERGRTRSPYSVSQGAIREFQVNTSSYSAEYGRSAGGVVNAVTKSGTNEFHGGAFYYQRNNSWGARNPQATRQALVSGVFTPVAYKPEDVRHQFGGTIGGPIVKDRAFFFFSYDEQRRNFPGLSVFSSPSFLNSANNTLLTARGLTTTQITNALTFLQSISGPVARRGDQRIFLPKVDWRITDNHTLTATYNRLRWVSPAGIQTQATNTRAVDNFGDDFVDIDSLNMRLASTLSPMLLNEARFQWSRDFEYEFSQPPLPGEPTTAVGGRSPQTFITNGFSFGIPEFLERVSYPDERRVQFADTLTYTAGNHTIKWGGDINFVKDILNNLRFSGGEFNYTGGNAINDFIFDYTNFTSAGAIRLLNPVNAAGQRNLGICPRVADAPGTTLNTSTLRAGQCYAGNFNQGFGVLGLTMKTQDFNYFIQDDWRVSPRLTLNLGLRYEYQRNPFAVNPNFLLPQTRNRVDDRNNFGPRVGFAYDVSGDGKTSVRGGWGLYYGRVINSTVYQALIGTGVGADRSQRQVSVASNNAIAPVYPALIPPGTLTPTSVQYFASNFQLPQIHQLDVIVEREIGRNTVVSASYLASFANSLPNFVDTNLPAPTKNVNITVLGGPFDGQVFSDPIFLGATQALATRTARPNPDFAQITEIRSNVFSKYNALVLQANRRLTNGLQFQTSYTLSRSADNGQTSQTFTNNNVPFNAYDQANENGLSAFDRRHKLNVSVVYNTHFFKDGENKVGRALFNGWTVAPIFNAFSGQRYSGLVSGSITPSAYGFTTCTSGGVTATCATPQGGVNGSGGSGRFALAPRNFFKQPNIWYVDMRVSRRFSLTENTKIELLAEGFNIFNRTQVTTVNTTLYNFATGSSTPPCPAGIAQCLTYNPSFGTTTGADSTLFRERQVQLAIRLEF
jgi:outer membrane receptor protein involved in Fe transport